jgi:hypothetical protein
MKREGKTPAPGKLHPAFLRAVQVAAEFVSSNYAAELGFII